MSNDQSPNLALPYIAAAQAQKHVTHNEALRALDAIVQLSVLDQGVNTPPASPAEGARYIVGSAPSGAWSGHAAKIAAWQDGAWELYAPREGFIAWVCDEHVLAAWNGTAWVQASISSINPAALVGVNATADATNRLSVSSPASLFNHEGAGHQQKINKAAAANTASLLFQTGFSGRAEMGTTGDDNWHLKVSADGATWREAMLVDRSSGLASFPFTPMRERLTAARTYYVRTDGSDANNGLANSSGGAFLTLQKAWSTAINLDRAGFTVTISVADGTYTAGIATGTTGDVTGPIVITGNTATPDNVVISATTAFNFVASCLVTVQGFKHTGSGSCIYVAAGAIVTHGKLNFAGTASNGHVRVDYGGTALRTQSCTISAGGLRHLTIQSGGVFQMLNSTDTITGTPSFTGAFAYVIDVASALFFGSSFSGSATGTRYTATTNGAINTFGGGSSFFPGSVAGTTSSGGQYV